MATNDVHYVRPGDARAQDLLVCVQTQTTMDDPNGCGWRASSST